MSAARRLTVLEGLLAVLVPLFAFASASFAVRNSDFWLHLASGRLLAAGQYTFGVDPFAYTTQGVYWANHAWLFDLLLYLAHQAVGGGGLVVLKALAVAALAVLLLRFRSPGGPFWVTAGCALLALLVMRPRLLLQPACLSLGLLGLVLWLVGRRGRAVFALPGLFVLWVNLDGWFVLGLLLVGLVGLSDWLGARRNETSTDKLPLWLLLGCLAGCLVSPHHVFAFRLPDELSPAVWTSELRSDPRFAGLFASPWRSGPLGLAGGFSLSAWAYLVLLGLGAFSFLANRPALGDWRLPVWLAFAVLGAWQARLAGFFAVVAGPIAALNLTEALAGAAPRRVADVARLGLVLAALLLLGLTWPGWLTGFHRSDSPLAWQVRPEPSLARLGGRLFEWREAGLPRDGRHLFAVHPDVAHYCAWYAPGEKNYLDSRLSLFLGVIADYERVCRGLDPSLGKSEGDWREVLDDNHVACVVLYDPDVRRLGGPLHLAVGAPERWPLLAIDGAAVVIGYAPVASAELRGARLDLDRLAFVPQGDDSPLPPAPDGRPGRVLASRAWWERFLHPPSGSSWERDAAAVYLRLFEEERLGAARRQERRVRSRQGAGLLGVPALPGGPAPLGALLASRLGLARVFQPDQNALPPALPLLAVRAARRAVAAHSDDGTAWLLLGRAYLTLTRAGLEAPYSTPAPLAMLRHVQTVTAFSQALLFDPDLVPAHEALAQLYGERGYLDLALRHRAAQVRLTRAAGPLGGESRPAFEERCEALEGLVGELERDVQDRANRFVIRTQALSDNPLARAHVALGLGLAGTALDDVLLRSQALLFGVPGARLQLELLLVTGRVEQARQLLDDPEVRQGLDQDPRQWYELPAGPGQRGNYWFRTTDWFDICLGAAAGDRARAGAALERLIELLRRERKLALPHVRQRLLEWLVLEVGAPAQGQGPLSRGATRLGRAGARSQLDTVRFLGVAEADLRLLEALLELEAGTGRAAEHLREAGRLYAGAEGLYRPGQWLANGYRAQQIEAKRAGAGEPGM